MMATPNTPESRRAAIYGIMIGWTLSFFGLWGLALILPPATSGWDMLARALTPPALALALGIGWAAMLRHRDEGLAGGAPTPGTPLDITQRYIANTVEQMALFVVVAVLWLSLSAPLAAVMLPAAGLWFFVGRMIYWLGYARAPLLRAVGFTCTFHVSVLALISGSYLLWF